LAISGFLQRAAMLSAVLATAILSVRPSHTGIVSKWWCRLYS